MIHSIAIVGIGYIGRAVYERLKSFNGQVYAYSHDKYETLSPNIQIVVLSLGYKGYDIEKLQHAETFTKHWINVCVSRSIPYVLISSNMVHGLSIDGVETLSTYGISKQRIEKYACDSAKNTPVIIYRLPNVFDKNDDTVFGQWFKCDDKEIVVNDNTERMVMLKDDCADFIVMAIQTLSDVINHCSQVEIKNILVQHKCALVDFDTKSVSLQLIAQKASNDTKKKIVVFNDDGTIPSTVKHYHYHKSSMQITIDHPFDMERL